METVKMCILVLSKCLVFSLLNKRRLKITDWAIVNALAELAQDQKIFIVKLL